jgi:NADPH2 dehydrogenase
MPSTNSSALFEPLKVGSIELKNRIVMAPLTRFRGTDEHVPEPSLMKAYYEQRGIVPGTLLITEGTFVDQRAAGYGNVPGLWNDEQITQWKVITDAVHAKGSFIYTQLWAMGRAANPDYLKSRNLPALSSSPLAMPASEAEHRPTVGDPPKEMTEQDIKDFIHYFARASKNAVAAGFDGVEIHAANGYLVDQFTQDVVNKRTDAWGGSVEKRARFAIEIAQACAEAIGADKVGIRLSPFSTFQGMKMSSAKAIEEQFSYLVKELRKIKLAYLHLVESRISGSADGEATGEKVDFLTQIWQEGADATPVLLAGGFTPESAKRCVDEEFKGKDVAVVFGRHFISTPDLVYRIEKGIELTPYDRGTFYMPKDPKGYNDYPYSKEFVEETGAKL